MVLSYLQNRSTGMKIALGMSLLTLLAIIVGGVGLFGTFRLGETITVSEKSTAVVVKVHEASASVDNFNVSSDKQDLEIAKGHLAEARQTLSSIGGNSDVLTGARQAIESFESAIDDLAQASTVIESTRVSQQVALASLSQEANQTLSDANAKYEAAGKEAEEAAVGVNYVQDLMTATDKVQASANRAGLRLLQASQSGDAKLLAQARMSIKMMDREFKQLIDAKELDKHKKGFSGNYEAIQKLLPELDNSIQDPEKYPVYTVYWTSTNLVKEMDDLANNALRARLDLNRAKSEAEMGSGRATFAKDEAGLAMKTGRSVDALVSRIDLATLNYQHEPSDANLAAVRAGLMDAEALGVSLNRAGASKVGELFASYSTSFDQFADATIAMKTAGENARKESLAATQSLGQMITQLAQVAREDQKLSTTAVIVTLLFALVLAGGIAFALSLIIGRPIAKVTASMLQLAEGKTDLELAASDRKDEIGKMLQAVLVFRDNAVERRRLAEQQRQEEEAQRRRSDMISELISKFQIDVAERLASMDQNAHKMEDVASNLAEISESNTQHATETNQATGETLQSATAVASAAEELTASISEISTQTDRAHTVVEEASGSALAMSSRISHLLQSANRIGDVVDLIKAIAEQTNLLALNATIEAARAGEAGRGFAVVAAEVKELATQTSKATEEIVEQVTEIQSATEQAVTAVKEITDKMDQANSVTSSIASAVIQQETATSEISTSAQMAANGSNISVLGTTKLLETVQSTADAAHLVLQSSKEVNEQSQRLQESIDDFVNKVSSC
ncbi:methyl-accepting chemotaxis protein [uncultured Cohaesibacter sp.]|uniref:methyl-accepting chemotaxis protein n=1 Tax=uncultured Cohaesibacter sp. TaxID=1002546 RepID=UPI0029C7320C|nr:methyl-accepting chemotaxis protein [uncultured Cohaesibacter sp.]